MAITWTKKFAVGDDGTVFTGAQLGQIQDDIDAGLNTAVVPTPTTGDAGKTLLVKDDLTGYQIITPLTALVGGTSGYPLISNGTAAPVYAQLNLATGVTGALADTHVSTKAWGKFDGTASSPNIIRGAGVNTNVTKNSTGVFTVTLATARSDASYVVLANTQRQGGISYIATVETNSTTQFVITIARYDNTLDDAGIISFVVLDT